VTEAEWLACADPEPMLDFLQGGAGERKLRLFACACCRHTSSLAAAESGRMAAHGRSQAEVGLVEREADLARRAAEAAERYADGFADVAELDALLSSPGDEEMAGCYADGADAARAARASAYRARVCARYMSPQKFALPARWLNALAGPWYGVSSQPDHDREKSAQCRLLRDIFGNPFRPLTVDPGWRAPTVTSLAAVAYEERALPSGELDPARLAVLADALEEAGCTEADALNHCRRPGAHVRGCWVIDLLLGKS
jgi:hypothetical protein